MYTMYFADCFKMYKDGSRYLSFNYQFITWQQQYLTAQSWKEDGGGQHVLLIDLRTLNF